MSNRDCCYHKAKWVVADSRNILENGYVQTAGGKILEVNTGRLPRGANVVKYGAGAIVPGLINAHTHLELCALKGLVPFDSGFREWVIKLLEERMKLNRKIIYEFTEKGILELKKSGCAAVGEISTLGFTHKPFFESKTKGVWFKEYIGNPNGSDACQILNIISKTGALPEEKKYSTQSMAVHGPHTTAPQLIQEILYAARKRRLPVSFHLAESEDELEFITTGKGQWADFLSFRGIKYSHWGVPAKSPVQYLEKLGALNDNIIAAHLLHVDEKDITILSKRGVKTCLCPRSNSNLHGRLPDLPAFLKAGLKPCLGTDSLASCDSLSIFDEMAFTARNFESVSPVDIFDMATINGAQALGFAYRLGALHPGKEPAMFYVPVICGSSAQVLEHIVNRNFQKSVQRIAAEENPAPSCEDAPAEPSLLAG